VRGRKKKRLGKQFFLRGEGGRGGKRNSVLGSRPNRSKRDIRFVEKGNCSLKNSIVKGALKGGTAENKRGESPRGGVGVLQKKRLR